jgi:hypothetical protein
VNYIKCPKCGREEPAFDYAHVCGPIEVKPKMNERIKLLKHIASLWCDENIPEQFSEETNGYGSAWEDKFAELIVRECAEVSENDITDGDACCTNTADRIARQIKKHFGVEE